LERIAREGDPGGPVPQLGPPVHHDPALLTDLSGRPLLASRDQGQVQGQGPASPGAPATGGGRVSQSLARLGLPPALCHQVLPTLEREALEAGLVRALRAALPPLPPLPASASSVMAVVGPAKAALATARALATEVGTPPDAIAIATPRKIWSRRQAVISSPEEAAEQRRSWRWRPWPAVVVVEQPVRPSPVAWSASVLQALEPTLCWGVAEASRKPEDLASWSAALGGLDVLAVVDLEGTTTPASVLACPVPVGRLDGVPATAEAWASLLCSRLAA